MLHWIVERLAARHEVHVFTVHGAPRADRFSALGATIHHGAGAWPTFRKILAEHRAGRFDVIHGFWLVPAGFVAAMASRTTNVPLAVHLAGGELVALPEIGYGHAGYWTGRLRASLAMSTASFISAASSPMVELVRGRGFHAERVPLGVDLRYWPVEAPRPRGEGPARLLHVGTLNRVKDQVTLLGAARRLADSGRDFTLEIVGFDTLNGEIQRLAAELGLNERVRFHGYLDPLAVRRLMLQSHVLLVSSRHEAGPLVMLEGAVSGVPTVGTAVGHVAEWNGEAAVALAVGDSAGLAGETLRLLEDDPRRLRLAAEAQRRAVAQDAEWTVSRFEAVYRDLVSGARRRGRG